ncbi:MAG: cyclase family protein [Acidobacteria bacterium]|nr:cyclase family protein [Acidobacteriota bacterium]MCB9398696.1 cyclase family protein [Acidobacteriota bacterium]
MLTGYQRLFDISPPITNRLGVFPGDVSYQLKTSMSFDQGDHLMLSSIETTLHLGAHADGPNHYDPKGLGIGERSLIPYLGPCQVVQVLPRPFGRIGLADIEAVIETPRILFKTGSFPDPNRWNSDFMALAPDLIHYLADQGVQLVGIDTPSIDVEDSKELPSHQAVRQRDLSILEGLVLSDVDPGIYQLVALPLRLMGADAAPVRAILLQ